MGNESVRDAALQELAASLGELHPLPPSALERFLSLAPPLQRGCETADDGTVALKPAAADSLHALTAFLLHTRGQHADAVLPRVHEYLAVLQHLDASSMGFGAAAAFVHKHVAHVVQVAALVSAPERAALHGALLDALTHTIDKAEAFKGDDSDEDADVDFAPVLVAMLRALGDEPCGMDDAAQVAALLAQLQRVHALDPPTAEVIHVVTEQQQAHQHQQQMRMQHQLQESGDVLPPLATSAHMLKRLIMSAELQLLVMEPSMLVPEQIEGMYTTAKAMLHDTVVNRSGPKLTGDDVSASLSVLVHAGMRLSSHKATVLAMLRKVLRSVCCVSLSSSASTMSIDHQPAGGAANGTHGGAAGTSPAHSAAAELHRSVLASMETVAEHYGDDGTSVVDLAASLQQMLLSVDWRSDNQVSMVEQHAAALARLLGRLSTLDGSSRAVTQAVYSVAKVVTLEETPDTPHHVQRNAIVMLGALAVYLNDDRVTMDYVMPVLMDRSTFAPCKLHIPLCEQLVEIAIHGPESAYQEVVLFFLAAYRSPFSMQNKFVTNATPNLLLRLATHLQSASMRADLRTRLLALLTHLGVEIQTKVSASKGKLKAHAMAGAMGMMLPTIAELVSDVPRSYLRKPPQALFKQFQAAWLYFVVFHFTNPKHWLPEWYDAVVNISHHTPVLVARGDAKHVGGTQHFTATELELNKMLRHGMTPADLSDMQVRLSTLLPSQTRVINQCTPAQVTYLLSVYNLETLRVTSGSFSHFYAYLEDEGLHASVLAPAISAIGDVVFAKFLEHMEGVGLELHAAIEEEVVFLLMNHCHRLPRVRSVAVAQADQLLMRFPHVLWNRTCLSAMLELLEAVGSMLNTRVEHKTKSIRVPTSSYEILLPDLELDDVATVLVARCRNWLAQASVLAPLETQSMVQKYLMDFGRLMSGVLHHSGATMAVNMSVTHARVLDVDGPLLLHGRHGSAGARAAGAGSTAAQGSAAGGGAGGSGAPIGVGGAGTQGGVSGGGGGGGVGGGGVGGSGAQSGALGGVGSAGGAGASSDQMLVTNASCFASSLHVRSFYLGLMDGMRQLSEEMGATSFVEDTEATLLKRFQWLIAQGNGGSMSSGEPSPAAAAAAGASAAAWGARGRGGAPGAAAAAAAASSVDAVNITDVNETMYRAAALMINTRIVRPSLLRMICWLPARLFRRDIMSTAITVWSWLDSSMPDISVKLFTEVAGVWRWTVQEGLGLFGGATHRPQDPFAVDLMDTDHEHPHRAERSHLVHRLWIEYLTERYHVNVHNHVQMSHHVWKMLNVALADPHQFSQAPESLGTRFMLLRLAMVCIHENRVFDTSNVELLRFRVYNAALQWFHLPSTWYDPRNALLVERDEVVLLDFCRLVRADKRFLADMYNGGGGDNSHGSDAAGTRSGGATSGADGGVSSVPIRTAVSGLTAEHTMAHSASMRRMHAPVRTRVVTSLNLSQYSSAYGSFRAASHDGETSSFEMSHVAAAHDHMSLRDEFVLRRKLLMLLVGHEISRMSVWRNPTQLPRRELPDEHRFTPNLAAIDWKVMVQNAWHVSPPLAVMLGVRFEGAVPSVEELVQMHPSAVYHMPEAVVFLVTDRTVHDDSAALQHLLYWAPVLPPMAVSLLHARYKSHRLVTQYALRSLLKFPAESLIFYLPQLLQAVRHDDHGLVEDFLFMLSRRNRFMCHLMIWGLQTESDPENVALFGADSPFILRLQRILQRIVSKFSPDGHADYRAEFDFIDRVTCISGMLKPLPPNERADKIAAELRKIAVPDGVYLPTSPHLSVRAIKLDSGRPMQSAEKVPIMVSFAVVDPSTEPPAAADEPTPAQSRMEALGVVTQSRQASIRHILSAITHKEDSAHDDDAAAHKERITACIFKVGDDCRQDQLALQVIAAFKSIFQTVGLELFLYPYAVVPLTTSNGVIECVRNARSRDQLGKTTEGDLYEYFLLRYGSPDSPEFAKARKNFIMSMAAYSVVSFILQIKDRHNGNILVTDMGHVVHIDFGFIFDISPGGDIKFERAPFKLSREMINIMGGSLDSEHFQWFISLCIQGYLACRQHWREIVSIVSLMTDSGLPCFKGRSIENLTARFAPNLTAPEAAKFMSDKINESFDKITTLIYDQFQAWANGIEF